MNPTVTLQMLDSNSHASREELNAFIQGRLREEHAVVVERHVSACDACCQTLTELSSSEDTFVQLLQDSSRKQAKDADSQGNDPPQVLPDHPRYEVVELVGEGGMGNVYRARHRVMERTVALKVISRRMAPDRLAGERFQREVKAAARLHHENIVTAYDAEHEGETHFLVMEYVEGVDLARVVALSGALPIAEACDSIRQAALGLQHAHELGMVHRDIKPHNLMRTADGVVKILDFGLAALNEQPLEAAPGPAGDSQLTSVGAVMGTPDYISPEQAKDSSRVDARSDLYSLGATFYFLLTGEPPFQEGSVSDKLTRRDRITARPVSERREETPAGVAAIVDRLMQPDPAKRFQSAAEVVQALESFAVPPAGSSRNETKQAAPFVVWCAAVVAIAGACLLIAMLISGVLNPRVDSAAVADGKATKRPPDTDAGEESADVSTTDAPTSEAEPAAIQNALATMKFVPIAVRQFTMGTPPVSKATPMERKHLVNLSRPFEIAAHEVTQQQYELVMGMNPSSFSATGEHADKVAGIDTARLPVENVSWEEANEFCRRLTRHAEENQADVAYRLPTEAEWEYACRGMKPTAYSFGEALNGTRANVDGDQPWRAKNKGPSLSRTAPVGSYSPNDFGLYDMHGNVWEWCSDWYAIDYYENSPLDDPQGPQDGSSRVVRGGAWNWGAIYARSAARERRAPDARDHSLGFRVVRVAVKPAKSQAD